MTTEKKKAIEDDAAATREQVAAEEFVEIDGKKVRPGRFGSSDVKVSEDDEILKI